MRRSGPRFDVPREAAINDPRLTAPSAARNREPILDVLQRCLPPQGLVLEVASGTGEHVSFFAAAMPGLEWQPTDPDAARRASVDVWTKGMANVRRAILLDAAASSWPVAAADAVLCINMLHIAPPAATSGLLAGAARVLGPGGVLVIYGPFRRDGEAMGPGNAAFDADLRARNPEWGLRVLEDVAAHAAGCGFVAPDIVAMPANNLAVIFRRV